MCLDQLSDNLDLHPVADAKQDDGRVTRNAVAPQAALASTVVLEHAGAGAPGGVGIYQRVGQTAVELGVTLRGIEMAQRHLAVRPRQVKGAVGHAAVLILFDERQRRFPAFGHSQDQTNDGAFIRRQRDRAPQRNNRVEDGAGGVGQRREVLHRGRVGQGATAPDKPRTIRFIGDFTLLATLAPNEVQQPRRLLILGPSPAGAEEGGQFLRKFGLHEEIAEGGMRRVRVRLGEHHFRVTGQFNEPHRVGTIGDRDPAQFHVVLWRHADLRMDFQAGMTMPKLRARLREDGFVAFGRPQRGLMSAGPKVSRRDIPEVNKCSPAIAGRILAPSGNRQVAPPAVAAARRGDDNVIAAVGQEMNLRCRWRGICKDTHHAFTLSRKRPRCFQLQVFSEHTRGGFRHAFLQQQVRRLEQRAGHEAPLHRVVPQEVDHSQQAHSLMVGHVGADGGARFVRGQSGRGIVHGLVESIGTGPVLGRQALQVCTSRCRRHHQGHRSGVGSNHQVGGQSSLQSQARHAERPVLVVQVDVGPVVTRLRDAPWDSAQLSIVDLLLHGGPAGVIEQRILIIGHDQKRHQVFEHRTAPRNQDRVAP